MTSYPTKVLLITFLLAGCTGIQSMSDKQLGIAKSNAGKHKEALLYFSQALETNQKDWELWFNRALTNQKLGFHEKAIEDANKSITLNPSNSESYLLSSTSKKAIGDFTGQVRDLKQSITINPEFAAGYINLGNIARDNDKDYVIAIANYSKAINILSAKEVNLQPKTKEELILSYGNRSIAYQRNGNLPKACKDIKKASSLGSIKVKQFLETPEGAWCKNMNVN